MNTPELQMFGEFPEEARLVSNRHLIGGLQTPGPRRRAPGTSAPPQLDAVVVPSNRGVGALGHAAATARLHGSWLVVLCSGETKVAQVAARYARTRAKVLPLDVESGVNTGPGDWVSQTDSHVASLDRDNDVSVKRNLALRIARLAGWQTMMFMDDDVLPLRRRQLQHALALLFGLDREGRPRSAVGFAFDEFRDDSVVGHACHLVGSPHETFIGAGTLLLRIDADLPYFPRIYNEDWLFLLDLIRRDPGSVALAGLGRQEAFDPFARGGDVERQEFGDVLAEALFRALPGSGSGPASLRSMCRPEAWYPELTLRRRLVEEALKRLYRRWTPSVWDLEPTEGAPGPIEGAVTCLIELQTMQDRREPWPDRLAEFTRSWLADCESSRAAGRKERESARARGPVPMETLLSELGLQSAWVHDGSLV
jgi:hypothetical protein